MTESWLEKVDYNQLWLKKLTKVNFYQKSWLKSTLAKKSWLWPINKIKCEYNGNLGTDNDIRVRTIIKQADIDTQLIILL